MAKQKRMHPADAHTFAQIARATHFTIYFRKGPFETFSESVATIKEARVIESRMNSEHGKFGRRAAVYAMTPEGKNYIVPESYR